MKQPAGHDRLCACDDCVEYYVRLAEQRVLDVRNRKEQPQRANSKYNPHRWRER